MQLRTDRVGLLLDQLDASVQIARARLEGLTDEEHLWGAGPGRLVGAEPGRGGHVARVRQGEVAVDMEPGDPAPAPVTTIAWRIGHLYAGFALRWEWTFGGKRKLWGSVELSPDADEAQARLWTVVARWREDVAGLDDAQLDTVGLSQFPHGLDPNIPFIAIVWWTNRELIHHTAEIGLLRDLWAARVTAPARDS